MAKKHITAKKLFTPDFLKGLIIGIALIILGFLLYGKFVQSSTPANDLPSNCWESGGKVSCVPNY